MSRPRLAPEVLAERKRVGQAIKEAREDREIRSSNLARALGISLPYLSNLEAGRVRLTDDMAERIAGILEVPTDMFEVAA